MLRPTAGCTARERDVLSSVERDELARPRRENRQLKLERGILAEGDEEEPAVRGTVGPRNAWFAGKDGKSSIGSTNS
jgi:hypothetical protein